jgi:hypothetical protein
MKAHSGEGVDNVGNGAAVAGREDRRAFVADLDDGDRADGCTVLQRDLGAGSLGGRTIVVAVVVDPCNVGRPDPGLVKGSGTVSFRIGAIWPFRYLGKIKPG